MCPPSAPKAPAPQPERPLRYLLSRDQARRAGMDTGGQATSDFNGQILARNQLNRTGMFSNSGLNP